MAELGNFTINITCPDTSDIEAFGELIGKYVEEQYKKLLEKEASKEKSYDDYLKEWETIISETSLGKKVCCGFSVGIEVPSTRLITSNGDVVNTKGHIPQNAVGPFVVEGESVYISKELIKDSSIQSDNYKEASSGWKLGKNGELELNTKASKVVIDNEVLELFDKNGTLRVRVQL